jgi:GTP-binding protein
VGWLRHLSRPYLLVYAKADKLSCNQQEKNAALLDAALKVHQVHRRERVVFSSQSGQGRDVLLAKIQTLAGLVPATPGG